jgi:hypothetical protein
MAHALSTCVHLSDGVKTVSHISVITCSLHHVREVKTCSAACVSLCFRMIHLKNCWTDMDEISYERYIIRVYPKAVISCFAQPVIAMWRKNKRLRWDEHQRLLIYRHRVMHVERFSEHTKLRKRYSLCNVKQQHACCIHNKSNFKRTRSPDPMRRGSACYHSPTT